MGIFDAVGIEHALARFFGDRIGTRGMFYDADVFRTGDPQDLAQVLRRVADTLERRLVFVKFTDQRNGSAKAQVEGCISQLRTLSERVKQRSSFECEDYHWEIFGALMMGIVGLLETLEVHVGGDVTH